MQRYILAFLSAGLFLALLFIGIVEELRINGLTAENDQLRGRMNALELSAVSCSGELTSANVVLSKEYTQNLSMAQAEQALRDYCWEQKGGVIAEAQISSNIVKGVCYYPKG